MDAVLLYILLTNFQMTEPQLRNQKHLSKITRAITLPVILFYFKMLFAPGTGFKLYMLLTVMNAYLLIYWLKCISYTAGHSMPILADGTNHYRNVPIFPRTQYGHAFSVKLLLHAK